MLGGGGGCRDCAECSGKEEGWHKWKSGGFVGGIILNAGGEWGIMKVRKVSTEG